MRGLVVLYLATVLAISAGVWHAAYRQGLEQLAQRGTSDLSLAADRLRAQLQHYGEVAVLMADHPQLAALRTGGDRPETEALLLDVKDKISALSLFYTDTKGRILASDTGPTPKDLAQADYFKRALQGALGTGHALSETYGARVWYFAAPSFGDDGGVQGVLTLVINIDRAEEEWRGDRPAIYFEDREGTVFISNRSELLFWQRPEGASGPVTPDGTAPRSVPVGAHEIWWIDWSPYVPNYALHIEKDLPVIEMTAHALVDTAPATRLALWQAAAVAALLGTFGALLFLAGARRRALAQANAKLETRVTMRTRELSDTNVALRREVRERKEAEAALKRAQADLVQAGKLSALGQMSAGISHELNQPLMAIQQYAENANAFMDRGKPETARDNLGRIADMARRMARIIKNLRAFARNESEPMSKVDVVAVITSAVELTETRLQAHDVTLDWTPPDAPVWVWGGDVRLGQVFVNLISNAADAMQQSAERRLTITIDTGATPGDPNGGRPRVKVTDTGPGIADPERIFDPFYSTKEVGGPDGMGLGLSISYGLVQSFGGTIRGANHPGGGAVFTVELDRWQDNEERAA